MTREAAEAYERYVARYILGPWAPLLVDTARLASGEHMLDLACGTGVVARAAAKRLGPTGRITAVDLNPGMIDVARSLPAPEGAPIEWQRASALELPLADASVDAVLCQQGLQFFPDAPLAMREMRRVLRDGGRIALSVWNSTGRYNAALGQALRQTLGEELASRFCASRRAPPRDELVRLAADAGFVDVDVRVSRITVRLPELERFALEHLSATPIAPEMARADASVRARVGASVRQQLAAFADAEGASYPEETYVLTAWRR